jgi:CHAT domain-containing protein
VIDMQRSRFFIGNASSHLKDLQKRLSTGTTLIEYAVPSSEPFEAYAWVVTTSDISAVRLTTDGTSLKPLLKEVLTTAEPRRTLKSTENSRRQLAQLLLHPLLAHLKTNHLVIVPSEVLAGIPFALLPLPEDQDGALLGERYLLTYAPCGQGLVGRKKRKAPTDGTFLLAGDPVTSTRDSRLNGNVDSALAGDWVSTARSAGIQMDRAQLPRLGFAREEIKAVSSELRGRKSVPYVGFEARRDAIIENLKTVSYAHLISHGLTDLQRPRASGLAFSFWNESRKPIEGMLSFEEIASLDLSARLVTLSACETAVGRVISEYGVPSLANAFLRAGAERVVSTLWKVDDAATAYLMARFYHHLFADEKPHPGEALWRAQMDVRAMKKWSNPYYWAGVTLSGDWRKL